MRKLSNEATGIIQFMQTTQILTLQHNAKHLSKQKIEQIGSDTAMGAITLYNDYGIEFLRKVKQQYIQKQTADCRKMGWKLITPEYQYEEYDDFTITTLTF